MGFVICSISMINFPAENLLIHEALLHDVKGGMWCAISATRNIGPIFFRETIFKPICYTHSYTIFFITCPITREPIAFYQQGSVVSRITNVYLVIVYPECCMDYL
jgi:hypothetical protein